LGGEITGLLRRWGAGDLQARDALVELVYREIRALAHSQLQRERPGQLLDTTALAHEAYLRLSQQRRMNWQSRSHFFGAVAVAMRRILVEQARKRHAAKRNAEHVPDPLDGMFGSQPPLDTDIIELDSAIEELAALDAQRARVIELRYVLGMSVEETAELLGCSPQVVNRDWAFARAWLARRLRPVRQS
jgi:RNA polymerase sigma factor (TIGR02999 family)